MSERTLTQVVTELEQVRGKLTSLEAQIQAQKDKALELAEELSGMMGETLGHFGKTLSLRDTDGLPAISRRRTRQQPTEGPNIKELKAWAANTNWIVPFGPHKGKSISEWKNRLPNEVKSALTDDYVKAN